MIQTPIDLAFIDIGIGIELLIISLRGFEQGFPDLVLGLGWRVFACGIDLFDLCSIKGLDRVELILPGLCYGDRRFLLKDLIGIFLDHVINK